MQFAPLNAVPSERFLRAPSGATTAIDRSGLPSWLNIRPPPGLSLEPEVMPSTPDVHSDVSDSESEQSTTGDYRVMRERRTTLHVRNLPCYFTRTSFMQLMDEKGLAGQYDFLYLPMDFKTKQSIGYSFVNFKSSTAALVFRAAMQGFWQWPIASHKVCSIQWSQTQGYEANVRMVRSSGVMNKGGVPDEYKPSVRINGHMIPLAFPRKSRGSHQRSLMRVESAIERFEF